MSSAGVRSVDKKGSFDEYLKTVKNKKIIPSDCTKLIWGFGAIHCMTQPEPKI